MAQAIIPQWVPNNPMTLPSNLIYNDQYGNPVYSLYPFDYLNLIGINVNNLLNNYTSLSTTVATNSSNINTLFILTSGITAPYTTPKISPQCLGLSGTTQGIDVVLSQLLTAWCSYISVTGNQSQLATAITKQCPSLNSAPSFATPGTSMSSITGWVTTPQLVADTLTNLWLTLCDARAGITNVLKAVTPNCSQVIVNYQPVFNSTNTNVNVYFSGYTFIPSGFTDIGSTIQITDVYNNVYLQSINIVTLSNSANPLSINISGSTLSPQSSEYIVFVNYSVQDLALGITCIKGVTQTVNGSNKNTTQGTCCPSIGTWSLPLTSGSSFAGTYTLISGLSFTPRYVNIVSKTPYNYAANNSGLTNLNQIYLTYVPGGATLSFDSGGGTVNYSGTLIYDWIAFP